MSKSREIRKYDEEFKRRAVQLYRTNEKSYETISEQLGIPIATLVTWVRHPRYANFEAATNPCVAKNIELSGEYKALKRELALAKEERDILKKALAIFSLDVPKR
jgi:transposase